MDVYDTFIRSVYDFPIKGINFRDITPLLADGEAFHQAIMDLNKELPSYDKYDKIIAAESRGFIFAAPLASMNNKGLVLARKAGKLPLVGTRVSYALEYGETSMELALGSINPGDRVILVDDIIATGGSAKAMVDLVRSAGGIPVMGLFLSELRSLQAYKQLEIPYKAIISYGLRPNDLLQIERSSTDDSIVKFVEKNADGSLACETKQGEKLNITKEQIVNIIEENDGKYSYIKYRD